MLIGAAGWISRRVLKSLDRTHDQLNKISLANMTTQTVLPIIQADVRRNTADISHQGQQLAVLRDWRAGHERYHEYRRQD
jgi:hypothetical protein